MKKMSDAIQRASLSIVGLEGILEERFQTAPINIIDKVKAIGRTEILESLHKQAMRCSNMESFNEVLAKATQ